MRVCPTGWACAILARHPIVNRAQHRLSTDGGAIMETLAKTVQVLSVVVGVVISVLSFNTTREKEAEARRIEASKPFLQLRQSLYMEAIKSAAILANREGYSPKELASAK